MLQDNYDSQRQPKTRVFEFNLLIIIMSCQRQAEVSCSSDAYWLGGSDLEYGDGQAGPCMSLCMGRAWHGAWVHVWCVQPGLVMLDCRLVEVWMMMMRRWLV